MASLSEAVLGDPERLVAVARARRVLPAEAIPLDAMAQMAARLAGAPMATVTLVDDRQEYFVGAHGLPGSLAGPQRAPLAYSLGKYVVSQDHPMSSDDMRHDSAALCEHPLATEHGVRAFLAVPVHDDAGRPVGALTVLDTAVRQWTDHQVSALLEIAEVLRPATAAATTSGIEGLDSAALLDSVQEAFLAVNPDGVVVGFNRAARELLGFTAAEVCGRPLQDQLLPDYDGQPIGAALGRLFAAAPSRPVTRQVSLCHRDGHRLPANVSLSVVRGASGALACAFLTDLSAQVAAEATAERHQNLLAALLESLDVGVIACDNTGRAVVINRALREARGIPLDGDVPDDPPMSAATDLLDSDLQPVPWQQTPLMRAWHGEQVNGVDLIIRRPGHRLRTFACTARLITGIDGQRLGAVAVAHEVTSLRRTERFRACHRAVDEALKVARSAAEAAPAILEAVTTALGWPCAELFLIDELTCALRPVGHWHTTGIAPEGFFGHAPRYGTGITGRVWQTGQAMWVPDIAHSPHLISAYEKDRVDVCVRNGIHTVLAVPVRDGGTLLGVLTCYADAPEPHEDLLTVLLDGVAAQIGVYVALRHAEELTRQLTRAQDDFIALVGHEMRTPLTSITANAGILADDSDSMDDDHREIAQSIVRNVASLQKIVETLLDLAGLEAGHLALDTGEVDLVEAVGEAVGAAEHHAADAGVRLHTELPSRAVLHGDARRLRQVLDDLVSNAVKYSPPGGDVHITLTLDDDAVQVCVVDTGIGTPAAERARVFDRFFRGSNVRHHGTTGSGLGLSLARTVIALHNGTISLTSNEPNGTSVCVRLPFGDAPTPVDV